jgi:hypothetical protein
VLKFVSSLPRLSQYESPVATAQASSAASFEEVELMLSSDSDEAEASGFGGTFEVEQQSLHHHKQPGGGGRRTAENDPSAAWRRWERLNRSLEDDLNRISIIGEDEDEDGIISGEKRNSFLELVFLK